MNTPHESHDEPRETTLQDVSRTLGELTLRECDAALRTELWPSRLRPLARLPFLPLARRLGATIAAFDAAVAERPLAEAAGAALARLGVVPMVHGNVPFPARGPVLVVANHPGVYDALALFAAIGRQDLRVIAAERDFLRALPHMPQHLLFVDDHFGETCIPHSKATSRSRGLRKALVHLRAGGCLLHFAAGNIEPDPAFTPPAEAITTWQTGVGALAVACQKVEGEVRLGLVSGVHSAALKQSRVMRALEQRGASTLAGLLQVALPDLLPVSTRVFVSPPLDPLPFGPEAATRVLEARAREVLRHHLGVSDRF